MTITLSKKQLRIIDKYGFRNKSVWIGERIEEWYIKNINELERVRNKIRWTQFKKNELEDELKYLAMRKEKLEAEETRNLRAYQKEKVMVPAPSLPKEKNLFSQTNFF